MAVRFMVSDGSVAKLVGKYAIAVNGQVREIVRAAVAQNGIVRQYYPVIVDPNAPDRRILWDTTSIAVRQQATSTATSVARILFTRSSGIYTYDNYPDSPPFGSFLSPALDGTANDNGKYLIRVTQVSGVALTGTLGTWVDLNAATSIQWSLNHTGVGSSQALADIEISEDDGAGSPIATKTVTKSVSFYSEVVEATGGEGGIAWTTVPRDLVEIKETVDADCELTFLPNGLATGRADTSGSFDENWSYGTVNPAAYKVSANLVSGTPPTGNQLGFRYPIDQVRQWQLIATAGEDVSCVLDVVVEDNTIFNRVKRITMHSSRTVAEIPPVWTTSAWSLSDVGHAQTISHDVNAHVIFSTIGNAIGRIDNDNLDEVQESDPWLPAGDAASDYEVRVTSTFGADLLTSHVDNQWYGMTSDRHFLFEGITRSNIRQYKYNLSVRRIGAATVTKEMVFTITGAIDDGEPPN